MHFPEIFPSCPYIHRGKHLFLIIKQIYLNYHYKIGIYLETFRLIHLLVFSVLIYILYICKLIYHFFNPTKQHSELTLFLSIHDLKIPDVLSASSDNELDIKLSINLSLYVIVFFITIIINNFFFN